jgi:hypothetical protein
MDDTTLYPSYIGIIQWGVELERETWHISKFSVAAFIKRNLQSRIMIESRRTHMGTSNIGMELSVFA